MIPVHVHTTVALAVSPEAAHDRLHGDVAALAAAATADAIATTAPLARTGGFRATALPGVHARPPKEDGLPAAVVVWTGDEEATGWPSMVLELVVTPAGGGRSRLAVLSARHPGCDLSTNRIDKVWRDRLARTAVHAFATALARALEHADDREPAAVGRQVAP
jgi:hypothetical protein